MWDINYGGQRRTFAWLVSGSGHQCVGLRCALARGEGGAAALAGGGGRGGASALASDYIRLRGGMRLRGGGTFHAREEVFGEKVF